jgi:PAS domain S-box-containing protein
MNTLKQILGPLKYHISIIDAGYVVVWANEFSKEFWGTEIVGKKCYTAYHGSDTPCEPCPVAEVFADGEPHEYEERGVKGADGSKRTFRGMAIAVAHSADARPTLAVEIGRDITEQRRAEEALKENEEMLRGLLNATTETIALIDAKGILLTANQAGAARLNTTVEETLGRCIYDVFPPDVARYRREQHLKVVRSGKPVHFVDTREGMIFDHNCHPIFNSRGEVDKVAIFTRDITAQKEAEEKLRRSEERFRTFMETASDFMFSADKEGNLTYVNASMARRLGYSKEEMIGMHLTEFLENKTRAWLEKRNKYLIPAGRGLGQGTFRTKDGEIIRGEAQVVAVYDRDGKYAGARGVYRDLTRRLRAEQALKERDKELEIKSRSLEDTNIALTVLLKRIDSDKTELEQKILDNIQGLAMPHLERLKKTPLSKKQRSYIDTLEANLKEIISPFSKVLSSRHYNLTHTEIQIANLIRQGKTTKEIAEDLHLGKKTIDSHRGNIRKKLGLRNKKVILSAHLSTLN